MKDASRISSCKMPSTSVRYLAVLVLVGSRRVGAGVAGSCAQPGAPFGIPCDSVGVNGTPYVPGVNCRLMAVDGYTRRYVVWVPPAACPPVPRQCSCSMERVATADSSCARPAGGKRRHRKTSSPFSRRRSSTSFWRHSVSRHAGTTTAFRPRSTPIGGRPAIRSTSPWPADDVKFIRQIGADVIQQLSTDPHRVFVAGFSSGGGMCARLGVEASDLIAAVACHSSGLHELHETLVGSRNLSAFFTLGTLDGNALDAVNAYLIALGQPPIAELPLDPSDLDRIPQIKTQVLLNLDSFNLEATPLTTVTGADPDTASCADRTTRQQRWQRVVLHVPRRRHPSVSQRDEQSRRVQPARFRVWPFFRPAPPSRRAAEQPVYEPNHQHTEEIDHGLSTHLNAARAPAASCFFTSSCWPHCSSSAARAASRGDSAG